MFPGGIHGRIEKVFNFILAVARREAGVMLTKLEKYSVYRRGAQSDFKGIPGQGDPCIADSKGRMSGHGTNAR